MIVRMLLILTAVAALLVACSDEPTSLVNEPGSAPYYTDLDQALKAAAPDQYVVVDFYTDW